MKCSCCKSFDSMAKYMYVDKNNNFFTEGQLTAFKVLHPEDQKASFKRMVVCGMCYETVSNQSTKMPQVRNTSPRPSSKNKKDPRKIKNHYICPFCHTANEPLRNTCKKCSRILFSTEYETKRVPTSTLSRKRTIMFPKGIIIMIGIVLIAIYILNKNDTNLTNLLQSAKEKATFESTTSTSKQISTYEWPDGSKYTGEFKNGQPHGKGTLEWVNGDTYIGEFLNGQLTGRGKLVFANGAIYEGNLLDGKPHGEGTMRYADGSTYSGMWVNGELE
ncbi:hypothetical protein COD11_04900 [Bacillus sp. AFS040349]|nr:hypothetical protein COD11_04900 [Bacillus sp. AFS040349]